MRGGEGSSLGDVTATGYNTVVIVGSKYKLRYKQRIFFLTRHITLLFMYPGIDLRKTAQSTSSPSPLASCPDGPSCRSARSRQSDKLHLNMHMAIRSIASRSTQWRQSLSSNERSHMACRNAQKKGSGIKEASPLGGKKPPPGTEMCFLGFGQCTASEFDTGLAAEGQS